MEEVFAFALEARSAVGHEALALSGADLTAYWAKGQKHHCVKKRKKGREDRFETYG